MQIRLTPELQAKIGAIISHGRYLDAESVIDQALELLAEYEDLRALRSKLQASRDQFQAGESREYTEELFEQLKTSAFERYRAGERAPLDAQP